MECTTTGKPLENNQSLDVEALRERIEHCKWCENDVKYIGKYPLPHTIQGKGYMPADFVLHERPCSSEYWAERRVDYIVMVNREEKLNGKTRSGR